MPSIDELELIHSEVFVGAKNPYNWNIALYYSSTEVSAGYCRAWSFDQNSAGTYQKLSTSNVTIPVRSF